MAQFTYKATNNKGSTVSGTVEATDRSAAISALTHENLKPISVKEKREGANSLDGFSSKFLRNKVKPDVLVIFTRQLSTMVGAGVPLLRALNALYQHADNPLLKSTLEQVATDVQ
ncbi:type II secretion system F family protein, partial [Candidatus Saccharibacteria bacterium]|nr:type II secretion system F family protein [Candidatus Saccharibacteria bacterium]